MRKLLILAIVAAAISAESANMASQPWVELKIDQAKTLLIKTNEDFVANYVKAVGIANAAIKITTNDVTNIDVGEGEKKMKLTYEEQTVRSLFVTNANPSVASYGITNAFLFVWDGSDGYINGNGESVTATTNCFVWRGQEAVVTNGLDRFEGFFDVIGALIQPSQAMAITNGLEVVK